MPHEPGRYALEADYFIPAGQGVPGAADVGIYDGGPVASFTGRTVGTWSHGRVTVQVAAGGRPSVYLSARREMGQRPFVVHFDNVLFRPAR